MTQPASLKTNFLRLAFFIGVLKLVAIVTLVWTSRELEGATKVIVTSRDCAVTAGQTATALSHYRRSHLLYRLTEDPVHLRYASEYEQKLSEKVDTRHCDFADAPRRAALVPKMEQAIVEYLRAEQDAAELGATMDRGPVEERIRKKFMAAHYALEELAELNTQAGTEASRRAEHVQTVTRRAGAIVGIGSIVLVGTLLLLLQRRLVTPMHRLAKAIQKAERAKRIGVPLGLRLPAELGEIERAVDDLSQMISEQRSAQHQFVAAVAHDLRNPLQSIRGYCSLVRPNKPLPPEPLLRKGFEVIDRQVGRLSRQLEDLLDTAHVQSGMLALNRQTFDLCELTAEVHTMFDNYSDKHRIVIEKSGSSLELVGDSLRLSQVLVNLVSNAVKYSPEGGTVTICIRRDAGEAVLSVSDQGIGIDAEQMENLFEPFRRGKRVRGLEIPGIGLGLSTSKRIVEAHGGGIEVASEMGAGSTFTVRLPLSKEPTHAQVQLATVADANSNSSLPPPPPA